jgi:hypothetical protein
MHIVSKHTDTYVTGSEVWLVKPDNIDDVFRICITAPRYPVTGGLCGAVIATDAELSAGGLVSTLKSCAVGLDLPLLFAVSIGYPLDATPPFALRRNRDLTPTSWPAFQAVTPSLTGIAQTFATGESEAFLAFIDEELRPALAEAFPIDPDDFTLTGQSFGGLFVLSTLLRRPKAFRRYLAVSSSLWWDDGALVKLAEQVTANSPPPLASVYMCTGELENQARFRVQFGPVKELVPPSMQRADMMGDMFIMQGILQRWVGDDFSVEAHIFPQESHESIMGAAFSRGLRRLYGNL